MGGGSKQKAADPNAVNPTRNAAMGTAGQSAALGSNFSAQQQQLYNMLWGSPGSAGTGAGTAGVVAGMLDPSKLNVTKPTGVYGLQKTNADVAAARQYATNAGNIKQDAANAGFGPGTPTGFVQDQLNQNSRALADTRGSNFTAATTNQYNDALNNFWKAAGMAQSGSTAAGQGALQGTGTAANVYNNLYGTATKPYTQTSTGVGNSLLGAAGTVGAAAVCVASGTLIRMADGSWERIEDVKEGSQVAGLSSKPNRVLRIEHSVAPCITIVTDRGQVLTCSESHTLAIASGGYVKAKDASGAEVLTAVERATVEAVKPQPPLDVWRLELDGDHTYLSQGIWSLE